MVHVQSALAHDAAGRTHSTFSRCMSSPDCVCATSMQTTSRLLISNTEYRRLYSRASFLWAKVPFQQYIEDLHSNPDHSAAAPELEAVLSTLTQNPLLQLSYFCFLCYTLQPPPPRPSSLASCFIFRFARHEPRQHLPQNNWWLIALLLKSRVIRDPLNPRGHTRSITRQVLPL